MRRGDTLIAMAAGWMICGAGMTSAATTVQPGTVTNPPARTQPPAQQQRPAPTQQQSPSARQGKNAPPSQSATQPPPAPPQSNAPQPQNPPQQPAKSTGGTSDKSSAGSSPDRQRRNMNQYPYGYPYNNPYYGQPQAGVYYPGGSPSGTLGNPNAAPQNNNNNNPAAGNGAPLFGNNGPADNAKPSPTPITPAPATPPDPAVMQATAELDAAMDHLREALLKTNADYQAAVADKRAAQAESSAVHANEQSSADAILAAATKVLEASKRVTQIERDAAVTDQQVQDAQTHLRTAVAAHVAAK